MGSCACSCARLRASACACVKYFVFLHLAFFFPSFLNYFPFTLTLFLFLSERQIVLPEAGDVRESVESRVRYQAVPREELPQGHRPTILVRDHIAAEKNLHAAG